MKDKTFTIMKLVAKYLAENKVVYEDELIGDLLDRGFEMNEIDVALFWLESMGLDINNESHYISIEGNYRVITSEEKKFLSEEAMGYLYALKKKGLVDNELFEEILEKLVLSGFEIKLGIDEIKLLTALIAYNNNKSLFNYIIDNDREVVFS